MDDDDFLIRLKVDQISSGERRKLQTILEKGGSPLNQERARRFLDFSSGKSGDLSDLLGGAIINLPSEVPNLELDSLLGKIEKSYFVNQNSGEHDFQYLPDSAIWISKRPFLVDCAWDDSINKLYEQGFFMPDVFQFREFLNLIEGEEEGSILQHSFYQTVADFKIWLNAKARSNGKELIVSGNNRLGLAASISSIPFVTPNYMPEKLVDYYDWLASEGGSGLPDEFLGTALEGEIIMQYIPFSGGNVARFYSQNGIYNLDCASSPSETTGHVVYACKISNPYDLDLDSLNAEAENVGPGGFGRDKSL